MNKEQELFFSERQSRILLGLFTIAAFFSGVAILFWERRPWSHTLGFLFWFQVIIAGYFFFRSGYGLVWKAQENGKIKSGFFRYRVLKVFIPVFLCNYAYMLCNQLRGVHFRGMNLPVVFSGLYLLNGQLWFGVEILVLYLVFYISFRIGKTMRLRMLLLHVFTFALMLGTMMRGYAYIGMDTGFWFLGEKWYQATLLFLAGADYALLRSNNTVKAAIVNIKKEYILILTGIGGVLLFLAGRKVEEYCGYTTDIMEGTNLSTMTDKLCTCLIQSAAALFLILFLIVLTDLLCQKSWKNPIAEKLFLLCTNALVGLSLVSLEFLGIQRVFLDIYNYLYYHAGILVYLGAVFLSSLIAAVIFGRIRDWIIQRR